MKKKLLGILLLGILIIGLTGCGIKKEKSKQNETGINVNLIQCLENELSGYLVTEKDDLIDIPLSEIKNVNAEKVEYFKGVYASYNKDNMYLIIYPKNGTYEAEEMNKFTEYFSNKFSTYQTFESPNIPTIYIHTKENNINIKDLTNKCITQIGEKNSKSLDTKTTEKLNTTNKIVIKNSDKILGTIKDTNKLKEIINAISSSNKYGKVCLSDGYAFDFELYDNNKLIETIHVWGDGNRILPASVSGCYYSISNGTDLRKIIERETDVIFYSILDYSDTCDQALELIYQNNDNKYYLNCVKSDKVMIKFMIENKVMTLKSALENNLISADKVASEYPDVLIKK